MQDTPSPVVSICMGVYNEETYIKETLKSLTSQNYSNIEILISDNSSTDNTSSICQAFAQNDPRITFKQQPENVGAAKNFFEITSTAKGKYIMWAAGHDLWSENLLSECVNLLENSPTTVVAYGQTRWIDGNGKEMSRLSGLYDTRGMDIVAKFLMVFWGSMNPVLGIIRSELMPREVTDYDFIGSDLVLLIKLILEGDFACTTSSSFFRRQNRPAEDYDSRVKRYKNSHTKFKTSGIDAILPVAKIPFKILNIIVNSKIKFLHKIAIILLLIPSFPIKYFIGKTTVR